MEPHFKPHSYPHSTYKRAYTGGTRNQEPEQGMRRFLHTFSFSVAKYCQFSQKMTFLS